MRFDMLPLVGNVFIQRLRQLIDQPESGLCTCEELRERLDRPQHVIQKLYEHNRGACRDALAGERQRGCHKE